MKIMTCKQLGGACNQEFKAETFEELVVLSKAHGMEMFAVQDAAHMAIAQQVMELMQDPAKMAAFYEDKKRLFEQLPVL
ncbi:MAG: DUF1059 domain-containing protein [Spirochaetota bacterium]